MPFKVRVRNFQSIEDAEILIEGLTVLTGTNNAGKSALFRAVRGAFTNSKGSDFVRHGAKHCIVDIEDVATGKTLTWKKGGDGTNDYVVNGTEYPHVGHGVPPEAKIFGVEPITAGGSELWPQIAPQITGVCFLLDEPGSVIAEAVADVERVNQLSRALKDCESQKRAARSELKTRRKDATVLAERREKFQGLDAVIARVEKLGEKKALAEKLSKALANMTKLRERYQQAQASVNALAGLETVSEKLPELTLFEEAQKLGAALSLAHSLSNRIASAKQSVSALQGLNEVESRLPSEARVEYVTTFRKAIGVTVEMASRFEEAKLDFQRAQEVERVLDGVSLESKAPEILTRIRRGIATAEGLRKRRSQSIDAVRQLKAELETASAELEAVSREAQGLLGALPECPTCGGSLDHVHV